MTASGTDDISHARAEQPLDSRIIRFQLRPSSSQLHSLAMGNSASSSRNAHDETVDYGHLVPQGIYTGTRDWNEQIVAQAIVDRKLAPFYRPLEDYEDDWDDEKILANRKEPPPTPPAEDGHGHGGNATPSRSDASSIASSRLTHHHKRSQTSTKEPTRNPEALIYRGAVECPICFLVRIRPSPTTSVQS